MKNEHLRIALRWIAYLGLLLLCYVLQTMPGFLTFFGVKPIFLVPVVVCVAMFEDVLPAALFSMLAGFLWDISSDQVFGFNALIFLLCGALISLACIYFFHCKWINSLFFAAILLLLQSGLELAFTYAIWRIDSGGIFLRRMLPAAAFTLLFVPPMFWLIKKLAADREEPARL